MAAEPPIEPVVLLDADVLRSPTAAQVAAIAEGRRDRGALGDATVDLALPDLDGPFHFSAHMTDLCRDICQRVDELRPIDMSRVLVTFVRCRNRKNWGTQAKIIPLRFPGGTIRQLRQGHEYQVQQFRVGAVEMLYVMSFYMPRFLNQTYREKLVTIVHELYHVGPAFNGDLRRFEGTDCLHNGSLKQYDVQMSKLVDEYLRHDPDPQLRDFLHLSFGELRKYYGSLVGVQTASPKLLPTCLTAAGAAKRR